MEFDITNKQSPAIIPNFPPMPKPEEFHINWEDKEIGDMANSFSGSRELIRRGISRGAALARLNKYETQMQAYNRALAVWKEQVATISAAIRTNK